MACNRYITVVFDLIALESLVLIIVSLPCLLGSEIGTESKSSNQISASRSDCASVALNISRQNLSRELESAVTDVSTSMRESSQIVAIMTMARTEDYFGRIRDLVLERVKLIEKCFRILRYSLVTVANPICLAREGLRLKRQITGEMFRWARIVSRMGQDEILIFKEGRSQRVIETVSRALNKAALPLARNLVKCVYGKQITDMLRI